MGNNVTLIPKQPARHSLLTNVENVVYMPLASRYSHGIVKIGNGLNITPDGLLSVDFTADWYSGVKTDVEQLKVDVNSIKTDIGELVVSLDNFEEVLRNHDTRIDNNANAIASKVDSTYLQNYYTKAETYNKQEINRLIVPTQGLKKEIVSELPTENISESTLYLVPKIDISGNDYYNEYLYISGQWELVGTTQTSLEGYVTLEDFNKLVNNEVQIKSGSNLILKIGGTEDILSWYTIAIGDGATTGDVLTQGQIAIGVSAETKKSGDMALGNFAKARGGNSIAIAGGQDTSARAFVSGNKAIQLGFGANTIDNTLQIFTDNIYNHNTHTLTVQNIELNGENLAEKLENAGGTNVVKVEEDTITTNKLEKVVHLSEAQYQELIANGSITIGEQTLTYDENTIYVTNDSDEDTQTQIDAIAAVLETKADRTVVDQNTVEIVNLQSTVNELTPKVMRALVTPLSAPASIELVAVDDGNSQTMIEIGEGLLLTNGSLKADLSYPEVVADGVAKTGAGDKVIETYISSDGLTWYRKWASGWKECGLINQTGADTKTLPIAFSNTNYIAICFTYRFDGSGYQPPYNQISGGVVSTNQISTGGFGGIPFSVYCCGY